MISSHLSIMFKSMHCAMVNVSLESILNWFNFPFGKSVAKPKPKSTPVFRDSFGNFELVIPNNWKLDNEDIGFYDGKYTISFHSPNGGKTFAIFVDTKLSSGFDLKKYAKEEIEAPSSGVYAKATPTKFRGMSAYSCEFSYSGSFGKKHYGRKIVFGKNAIVFVLNCASINQNDAELDAIFQSFKPLIDSPITPSNRKTIAVQ